MDVINKKKIEFYTPPMMGHAYPLAKVAELVQASFPEYEVTFITLHNAKRKLEKDFPTLSIVGLKPEFDAQKEKDMVTLPPDLMFP